MYSEYVFITPWFQRRPEIQLPPVTQQSQNVAGAIRRTLVDVQEAGL